MVRLSLEQDVMPLLKKINAKHKIIGGKEITIKKANDCYYVYNDGRDICIGSLRECYCFLKGFEYVLNYIQ